MTEAAAWREVARRLTEGEGCNCGLCYGVGQIRLPRDIRTRMLDLLEAMYDNALNGKLHYWPAEGATDQRVLAACFLAAIAEVGE